MLAAGAVGDRRRQQPVGSCRSASRCGDRAATAVAIRVSVSSGRCGPCCSVEPTGTSQRDGDMLCSWLDVELPSSLRKPLGDGRTNSPGVHQLLALCETIVFRDCSRDVQTGHVRHVRHACINDTCWSRIRVCRLRLARAAGGHAQRPGEAGRHQNVVGD